MKRIVLFGVGAAIGLVCSTLPAQVPGLINYQGRVVVGGANFNGTGQFKFALVNGAGTLTYWSNDGTSTNGSEPTNPVLIAVNNGLYSVLLGATSPIPTQTVFNNSDVRLRVWFNDGTNGSQLLSPDQRIASGGYAFVAANLGDFSTGAIAYTSGNQLNIQGPGGIKLNTGGVGNTVTLTTSSNLLSIGANIAAANANFSGVVTTPLIQSPGGINLNTGGSGTTVTLTTSSNMLNIGASVGAANGNFSGAVTAASVAAANATFSGNVAAANASFSGAVTSPLIQSASQLRLEAPGGIKLNTGGSGTSVILTTASGELDVAGDIYATGSVGADIVNAAIDLNAGHVSAGYIDIGSGGTNTVLYAAGSANFTGSISLPSTYLGFDGSAQFSGNVMAQSFTPTSDRNAKEQFRSVNVREILSHLASLPIQTWNFKQDDSGTQHIGPMAQDFYAAFQVGPDDKHIATVDADGVAFAAIQGLNEIVQEQNAELVAKAKKIDALERRLDEIEKTLKQTPSK